ncbi:hypothetical protein HPB50_000356 [Hyalomma asiaticum]|uniref:Uncharacterized protein n=1 Tax=Hyalomma asiaticum TaxID=266040 RepID=A0ACB7SAI7_HYAAI|nr:hypothetical protein HPB50_000356 [Hyalomma asiaticum]
MRTAELETELGSDPIAEANAQEDAASLSLYQETSKLQESCKSFDTLDDSCCGARIRKADADYPQKRKIRGRFSGSRPDRFCPRGKVGRFGRSQSGPESPASIMSEPAVLFSVELLLDTIKQHLVLYKTNPRYKEAEYKKEIWKKIAQDLGVTSSSFCSGA